MPKCATFGLFWSFHFKDTPKVGVHREKFNIGNVAQTFFGGFYICWDYVISFSQHFPMKNFSPSLSTSPSPSFHPLFEIWLKIRNQFFSNKIWSITNITRMPLTQCHMLGLCHFIFATFPHENFFTVTVNVTVTRVPRTF